ncbi:hypothetical protein ABH935_001483 [Catenulispora sp. GAS73]|uniref:hypothetical protein n=1 Tax=Catenulispora sp. GAS73 TaxID=3156269 RepID=UPI00351743D8
MARTTPARPLDIEAVFPQLSEFRATATRLHPRPAVVDASQSSVGGPLLWPADEAWPTCPQEHRYGRAALISEIRERRRLLADAWTRVPAPGARQGPDEAEQELLRTLGRKSVKAPETEHYRSLLPLAQVYARDVPDLPWPDDADLLQLLWCPYDAHGATGYEPLLTVVWRRAEDVGDVLREPPLPVAVGYEGYVAEPCALNPERVTEHQDIELLPDRLRDRLEDWEDWDDDDAPRYSTDLSVAPGWKTGGFAAWPVTGPARLLCECGDPMSLLVRIASSEWDGGTMSWIPLEDRATADAYDASVPTQVVVGRGGSLNVFVCDKDVRHQIRLSVQ